MSPSRSSLTRAVVAASVLLASLAPGVATPLRHPRLTRPAAPADAGARLPQGGEQPDTSGTRNNGYVYNSLDYGRFVPGPDGSFGGYPAGSDGAKELMIQQRRKCQAVPEEC